MIAVEEAFEYYVNDIWELLFVAAEQGALNPLQTCDFILHRAAYLFVRSTWDEIPSRIVLVK